MHLKSLQLSLWAWPQALIRSMCPSKIPSRNGILRNTYTVFYTRSTSKSTTTVWKTYESLSHQRNWNPNSTLYSNFSQWFSGNVIQNFAKSSVGYSILLVVFSQTVQLGAQGSRHSPSLILTVYVSTVLPEDQPEMVQVPGTQTLIIHFILQATWTLNSFWQYA